MAAARSTRASGAALHDLFREVFALQAALAGIMDAVHAEAGLTTSQHRIIRALEAEERATVPRLATTLGVSRQFVQTACNAMNAAGLVAYRENPHHRRSRRVFLTQKGRKAFREARRKENAIIARNLPDIDTAEAEAAAGILAEIRNRLPDGGART
jgi:DNA-binding MarR family transcriptional regulator